MPELTKSDKFLEQPLPKTVVRTSKDLSDKFVKRYIDKNGMPTDTELKEIKADYKKRFTIYIVMDFEGVTVKELIIQGSTTTSFTKMLYNNVLKELTEKELEKICAEGEYGVRIRDLLDNRKTKVSDPDKDLRKVARKYKEKGLTREEINKKMEEMFNEV